MDNPRPPLPEKEAPPKPKISAVLKEKRSRQGRALINNLYALLKTALIHESSNEAYQNALEKFQFILKENLEAEETINIR